MNQLSGFAGSVLFQGNQPIELCLISVPNGNSYKYSLKPIYAENPEASLFAEDYAPAFEHLRDTLLEYYIRNYRYQQLDVIVDSWPEMKLLRYLGVPALNMSKKDRDMIPFFLEHRPLDIEKHVKDLHGGDEDEACAFKKAHIIRMLLLSNVKGELVKTNQEFLEKNGDIFKLANNS